MFRFFRPILTTSLLSGPAALVLGLSTAFAHAPRPERLARLDRLLAERPTASLHVQRAGELREAGEPAAALRDCDLALVLDPEFASAYVVRGWIALDAGREEEAIAAARRARELGDKADAFRLEARACGRSGRTAESLAAWNRLIADGGEAVPADYLARARLLSASSAAAAIASLDEARRPLGWLPVLEAEAVAIARRAGLFDEALERVDALAAAAPRQETWLAERGRILLDAGRRPEAWAAFTDALAALRSLPASQRETVAMYALEEELHRHLRPPEESMP